jgi:NADPH:quinone reductase-like Zn-dependent oxidoreductase
VPLAGLTAWTGIFGVGKLQAGQRILIHGASGGVGSLAVQLAKAKGAYVIGLASSQNLSYLRELGADEVIDYTNQRFEEVVQDVDVVFDGAPHGENDRRMKSIRVLKEGGILASVNINVPFSEDVKNELAKKKATGEAFGMQARQDWLQEMAQLIDDGKVKVIISKVYPLEQVAEAHRESETWHVRGKLVLEIIQSA